ncbi:AAA family ATPase [Candidatus Peregrinibacteria bacterium]|nr:AAA family ATPase [Candidatus Peregrinibacteria bacterium]
MANLLTNPTFLKNILFSNSPWLKDPKRLPEVKPFKREAFFRVKKQMGDPHKMAILIKGPRRVGKTEIQKQLIVDLIERDISPQKILYLSLDDAQIQAENPKDRWRIVNDLLNQWATLSGVNSFDEINTPSFCFLDEVQAVDNWAQLVKIREMRVCLLT